MNGFGFCFFTSDFSFEIPRKEVKICVLHNSTKELTSVLAQVGRTNSIEVVYPTLQSLMLLIYLNDLAATSLVKIMISQADSLYPSTFLKYELNCYDTKKNGIVFISVHTLKNWIFGCER